VIAGSKEKGRDFVYFTEVKNMPATDLATMERLWNKFSKGKFGYSVQKVGRNDLIFVVSTYYRIGRGEVAKKTEVSLPDI